MTARRIDVTVAREGGCWFAHRSDRPGEWVLVESAGQASNALASFIWTDFRRPGLRIPRWKRLYIGTSIAHGEVTVHG